LAIDCREQGNWSRTEAFCAIGAIVCTRLPIPGSAQEQSTAAQKCVEELGVIGIGFLPAKEVRQNSGNAENARV